MKRSVAVIVGLACLTAPVSAADPINIDIGTPPVTIIKHSIVQRSSRLVRFYVAGTIGQGDDGLIYIRDESKLSLPLRQIAEKLVDIENNERKALAVAVADSNGRKDATAETWAALTERWKSQFKTGWWLRDSQGNWTQKP
jgi:hypothetical protein